jgi:hypothetical protein
MANQVITKFRIDAQGAIASLNQYNTQLQRSIQLQKQLGASARASRGGGGGVGGGGGAGGGGGLPGLGALGALKGIPVVGAALGAVFSAQAASQLFQKSIQQSIQLEQSLRSLSASGIDAGKSFDVMIAASNRFAEAGAISQSAAAKSTAQLQRLLTLAGQGDQLEKYQQGFLDLAAARGVAFEELETLFQGIIAGTDDALNRFGKADPSKLYDQYAKSIGKSTDQLTQQQRTFALLNAFAGDFEKFQGANEDRINSFEGRVDKFNSTLDNTLARLGQWIASSRTLNDVLFVTGELLESPALTRENQLRSDISRRVVEGETPAQIAAEFARKYNRDGLTGRKPRKLTPEEIQDELGKLQLGFEPGKNIDEFRRVYRFAERLVAAFSETEKQTRLRLIDEEKQARLKAQQETTEALLKSIERERKIRTAQLSLYETQWRTTLDKSTTREIEQIKAVADARLANIREETNERLRGFASQFGSETNPTKRLEILNDQSAFQREQQLAYQQEFLVNAQRIAELEKKLADDRRNAIFDLAQTLQTDNPYVKLFTDAEKALISLEDRERDFGSALTDRIRKATLNSMGLSILTQDISNLRSAVGLRREAFEIGAGFDPSRLSGRRADAYRRQVIADDLNAIERAYQRRAQVDPLEAQRARDRAIIEATQGATPRQLTAQTRGLAVEAREREAARLEQDRDRARTLFDTLIKEFSGGGVRVRIAEGEQYVYVVNKAGDKAEVASKPGQGSTNQRYGR